MGRIALDELSVDRIATRIRHAKVEQQHVVAPTLEQHVRLRAGGRSIDGVAKAGKIPDNGGPNRRLVVDDEDAERASAGRRHLGLRDGVGRLSAGGMVTGNSTMNDAPPRVDSRMDPRSRTMPSETDRPSPVPLPMPFVV